MGQGEQARLQPRQHTRIETAITTIVINLYIRM